MALSEERLAQIREMSNAERVDRIDVSAFTQEDWERFEAELDGEMRVFCRENTDPEELHAFADTYNWDAGLDALRDILQNPACEAATALLIYWKAAPEYYRQYHDRDAVMAAKADIEVFDVLTDIETRYCAGALAVGRVSFDPHRPEDCNGYPYVGSYSAMKDTFVRALPEPMYIPVVGDAP